MSLDVPFGTSLALPSPRLLVGSDFSDNCLIVLSDTALLNQESQHSPWIPESQIDGLVRSWAFTYQDSQASETDATRPG